MGLLATVHGGVEYLLHALPLWQVVLLGFAAILAGAIAFNVLRQLCFHDKTQPPEVFSIFPFLGNT